MARAATRPALPRVLLYYSKDADDLLMRRTDGKEHMPPDEYLVRDLGWRRYRGPMVEWARLSFETEESARQIARENDWPSEWW